MSPDNGQPVSSEPAPAQPAAPEPERDAVIFLPGLGTVDVGDSVDDTARRIASAFDDEADPADQFTLEEGRDEDYGASGGGAKSSTRRITVTRKAGVKGPATPLLDVYSLDYRKSLIGDLPKKTPFKTLLLICWTVLMLAPKLLFSVQSKSKNSAEKWQVRRAWVMFFALGLYALIVLAAFLGTLPQMAEQIGEMLSDKPAVEDRGPVEPQEPSGRLPAVTGAPAAEPAPAVEPGASPPREPAPAVEPSDPPPAEPAPAVEPSDPPPAEPAPAVEPSDPPPAEPAPQEESSASPPGEPVSDGAPGAQNRLATAVTWLSSSLSPLTGFLQGLVVWLTAIGLLFKRDIKALIEKSGVETVSASHYLSIGKHKTSITGQFSALLNHIAQKEDVKYRNYYVLTYSFGGVVAIDTLFTKGRPANIFSLVNQLVTIACPFDFVRTYWPDYFDRRTAAYSSRKWLNIFTPADVLSSDFMDVANGGAPREAGVGLEDGNELVRPQSISYGDQKSLDDYSALERLLLVGFKNHAAYWEGDAAGCFGIVVTELFPDAVAKPAP